MAEKYKCSDKRLAIYFEGSRDKWKERAGLIQTEKRLLQLTIRDITRSKEKWKEECLQLRKENAELKKKRQKMKELIQLIIEE